MTIERKIKRLLSESDDALAIQCLAEANGDLLLISATVSVPRQQIQAIYRRRFKLNEDRGNPIQGFTELIAGLEATMAEGVIVQRLRTAQNVFAIFTDAERTSLIGVLCFSSANREQTELC